MTGEELLAADPTLREIVRRIVEGWHPLRIILFGSRARGEAKEFSDYDLLVVMPHEGNTHRMAGEMHRAMIGAGGARDIVITSPEMFLRRRAFIGTIEHEADKDGIVIYDAAAAPASAG